MGSPSAPPYIAPESQSTASSAGSAGGEVPSIPTGFAAVTADVLKEQQTLESVIHIVRGWMEHPETVPDDDKLHTLNPEVQHLWTQRQTLEVKDGVLYWQSGRPPCWLTERERVGNSEGGKMESWSPPQCMRVDRHGDGSPQHSQSPRRAGACSSTGEGSSEQRGYSDRRRGSYGQQRGSSDRARESCVRRGPPGQRGPIEQHEPASSHRQRDRSQLPATGRVRRGPEDNRDLDETGLGDNRQSRRPASSSVARRISAASRDQASRAETASATVRSEAALRTTHRWRPVAPGLGHGDVVVDCRKPAARHRRSGYDRRPLPSDAHGVGGLLLHVGPGPPPPTGALNDPGLD